MAKPNGLIFIVWTGLTIASVTCAEVIYVDANSPHDPGTGTFSDPFRRIQDAIDDDDTSSGDIIQIQPGVYTGPGNYNIDPNGFAITIRSSDPYDWTIVANTIIDPNGTGRGFCLHTNEDPNCIIAGLTITNAYSGEAEIGGGIYCANTSPVIMNCVITNSVSDVEGGGIGCDGGSPVISNCIIANNVGWYGGGVGSLSNSRPELINCTVVGNTGIFNGGGVHCLFNSHSVLKNCIIRQNNVEFPLNGDGFQLSLEFDCSASISYTDLQDGQEAIYTIESVVDWLSGNIDTDPNFVLIDTDTATNTWDFRLQSQYGRWDKNMGQWVMDPVTSPCIDAGDPNSDYTNEPWPHGGRVNMGAYGGTRQASMNGNRADFNIDGAVNLVDFAEFAKRWLSGEACIEDMTGDSKVDSTDLAILAYNWLWKAQ